MKQKQTCICNKIYYNIKLTQKLEPGLVASYDIRPGNGEGLFWFQRFINLSLTYLDTYPLTYSPGTTRGPLLLEQNLSGISGKIFLLAGYPACHTQQTQNINPNQWPGFIFSSFTSQLVKERSCSFYTVHQCQHHVIYSNFPSHKTAHFGRRFYQLISWLSTEKLNLTQQKQTSCIHNKKYHKTK